MQPKTISILLGVTVAIAFLAYSVIQYQKTSAGTQGIVTCAEGQCYWSAHMHTLVRIHQCGERVYLPKFTGPLSGQHTHAEENIVHWHEKLLIDPQTKNVIDPTPLLLSTAIEILGVQIADSCPDTEETSVKFFINGEFSVGSPAHRWLDQDIIDIVVDDRSIKETQVFIHTLSKQFPKLGEE